MYEGLGQVGGVGVALAQDSQDRPAWLSVG